MYYIICSHPCVLTPHFFHCKLILHLFRRNQLFIAMDCTDKSFIGLNKILCLNVNKVYKWVLSSLNYYRKQFEMLIYYA